MIHPWAHLRKPCYGFSFLQVMRFTKLYKKCSVKLNKSISELLTNHSIGRSKEWCVRKARTESTRVDDLRLSSLLKIINCNNLPPSRCTLQVPIGGVGVQPRTSKGITDLSLPQTSLRWKQIVPVGSNQIRNIFYTFPIKGLVR